MSYIIPAKPDVWVNRGQGDKNWGDGATPSITSSDSGEKLAAVASGGRVFLSNDYGVTWFNDTTPGSNQDWRSIASDSTGEKLVAVVGLGDIWRSIDSGVSWVAMNSYAMLKPTTPLNWCSVASNNDGTVLVAASSASTFLADNIWYSPDSGSNWFQSTGFSGTVKDWWGITSNAAGTRLAATLNNNTIQPIWTSSDGGASWTGVFVGTPAMRDWRGIASNSDGKNLIAAVEGGRIWRSTNHGSIWSELTGANHPPVAAWRDVTSSGDGNILVAVPYNGNIWKSTDSGATWTEDTTVGSTQDWGSVTSNAAGDRLAAVAVNGDIWTWPLKTPAVLMPDPACDVQVGGPQPPRLWSRAPEDCINTGGVLVPAVPGVPEVPAVPAVYDCCGETGGEHLER